MTLHTLCGIHAGKGNEQETIMDYKTSKLYKQNEKVILYCGFPGLIRRGMPETVR